MSCKGIVLRIFARSAKLHGDLRLTQIYLHFIPNISYNTEYHRRSSHNEHLVFLQISRKYQILSVTSHFLTYRFQSKIFALRNFHAAKSSSSEIPFTEFLQLIWAMQGEISHSLISNHTHFLTPQSA